MAIRREILLIVVLLLLIAGLVKVFQIANSAGAEPDANKASSFVSQDLAIKYPGADIAIMSVKPKLNDQAKAYYEVEARVTQDPNGPCPQRSHIFYNYPEQNFVPQPTEVITSNCSVCTQGICNLAFPEEAVIASHTFPGTEAVASYISANSGIVPTVTEKTDGWVVSWTSADSPMVYVVEMHNNGSLLNVTRLAKG